MNQSPEKLEFSPKNWRTDFLRAILLGASVLGLFAIVPVIFGTTPSTSIGFYIEVYLILLLITFLPIPVSIKSATVIFLFFSLGILGLVESDIRSTAPIFILGAITISALLFSWRTGWVVTGISMLFLLGFGGLISSGTITIANLEVTPEYIRNWLSGSAAVLLLAMILINGIRLIQNDFIQAQDRTQSILDLAKKENIALEQRIEERAKDLAIATQVSARRAKMFQAVAQVTRAITSTQNLQDLLPQITQAISQYFDFYHTGIFLINTGKDYAILSATNSEGGQKMLERNHKLRVGQVGIVGYVAGTGKPRIALDTGADAIYFNNPDLPETRSEMALPLQINNQIIGVLDIQSTEPNAFSREDIEILLTLADQVAVAIINARAYEETQKNIIESEMLYRQDMQTGWKKFSQSQKIAGIRRIGMNSSIYTKPMILDGTTEVINSGEIYFKNDKASQMTMPVRLRDQIVGMINIKTDRTHKWTDDEKDIIAAIAERAALSVESARLLEESRSATDKERAIGEISAKISASTQIETILKTAVRELGRQIGDAQISVEIENNNEE